MVSAPQVGVLALQGASAAHRERFAELGLRAREVRAPEHLEGLTHLVLPGGESTTLHRLTTLFGLREPIAAAHREGRLALFGTCAGAILLGRDPSPLDVGADLGEPPPRLGLLDAVLRRNAYGRQVDSFTAELDLPALPGGPFHGVFIRAPRVLRTGDGVEVLARHEASPVLLRGPGLLASTFHPELTRDLRLHRLFLETPPAEPAEVGSWSGRIPSPSIT